MYYVVFKKYINIGGDEGHIESARAYKRFSSSLLFLFKKGKRAVTPT